MISAEEYVALTGQEAPDGFAALLPIAEELLHARTLQQYRREGLPDLPVTQFKRALAMQLAFMDSRGGMDGWADPGMMTAGVTLGRFSVQGGSSAKSAGTAAAEELLAPGAAALLPTLMSYARAWMGGDGL